MHYIMTESERVLEDNYLMYAGYIYIVDNKFTRSNIIGTVGLYKSQFGAKEIRRCDLFMHNGAKVGDMVYKSHLEI